MPSEHDEIVLNYFRNGLREFTQDDIKVWMEETQDPLSFEKLLISSRDFIALSPNTVSRSYISKRALLIYVSQLNERLAIHGVSWLSAKSFWASLTPILELSSKSDAHIPDHILELLESRSLALRSSSGDGYYFPLAVIAANFIKPPASHNKPRYRVSEIQSKQRELDGAASDTIHQIALSPLPPQSYLRSVMEGTLLEIADVLSERDFEIVKRRRLIEFTDNFRGKVATLDQLGGEFGITRERVRQIEIKSINKLISSHIRSTLIRSVLYVLAASEGRLFYSREESVSKFLIFCCDLLSVPMQQLSIGRLIVFSFPKQLKLPSKVFSRDCIYGDQAHKSASQIIGRRGSYADSNKLAEAIRSDCYKRLSHKDRVIISLYSLGKPSHYADITSKYNELFPESKTNFRNVHAVLSDRAPEVVWVGVKGTYALSAWGYERPSQGLYDTVTMIVKQIFEVTNHPVSVKQILGEMPRHRKAFTHNGVLMAISLNPKLRQISSDTYVLITADFHDDKEEMDDELDSILSYFED